MLPKIDVPIYEITLPLSEKKVKIRPFLVKEEKILLMAMESEDEESVLLAIKQIVNNCCVDNINVDDLPILDLEYMFLQLRARSVGEVIDLQYKCNNEIKDEEGNDKVCNHVIKLSFNALEIYPEKNENHSSKIQLTPKLGVVMKYPDFKIMEKIRNLKEAEVLGKLVSNSIDYIYDEETLYYAKDASETELLDFVDSLTRDQFQKIQDFFDNIPKMKKTLDFKCGKCGYQEEMVLEGIQSFFV
jgi:DNA-directed RNA polymerase subunit M/transcription elongation factor TFIIS